MYGRFRLFRHLFLPLAVCAQPIVAKAQSVDAAQAEATQLIAVAVSAKVGHPVRLKSEPSVTTKGLSKGSKVAIAVLTGASGLFIATKLHPTVKIRDDIAATGAAVSGNGAHLLLALASGGASVWSLRQGKELARIGGSASSTALALSSDGASAALGGADGAISVGLLDGRTPLRAVDGVRISALAFDETGDRLAVALASGRVELWDVKAGARLGAVDAEAQVIALAFARKQIGSVTLLNSDGTVLAWDSSRNVVTTVARGHGSIRSASIAPDGASALAVSGKDVLRIDLQNGKAGRQLAQAAEIATFIPTGGASAIQVGADGAVRLVDAAKGADLARLITTAQGWAVLDQAGRFDGSTAGIGSVTWSDKNAAFSLRAFATQYFEPGVLTKLIADGSDTAIVSPAAGLRPPPSVTVTVPPDAPLDAAKPFPIVVVAEDGGGGIASLRLFHNGKVVDPGSLVQQRDLNEGGRHFRAAVYRINPLPGLDTFRASASSEDGVEVTSPRASARFPGESRLGALNVVSVGIDTYTSVPALHFARADAEALAQSLDSGSPVFASVSKHIVTNADATKAGILKAIADTAARSKPEDTIVIFLSGHGAALGKDEWVFAPVDIAVDSEAKARATAISAKEIQDLLVGAPAKRIVLAVDACNSAGAFGPFLKQSNFYMRLLADISRSTGVVVYAASRGDETAKEVPTLGHGVFTYVLMEALKGAARADGADIVTAFGVADYIEQAVPPLVERYRVGAQNTSTFELGADFPLR